MQVAEFLNSIGWADIDDADWTRLSAALPQLAELLRPQWRDIADAPKDGSEVWAFNGEQARMQWMEGDGYALWVWSDEVLRDVDPSPEQPTHFMDLPAPPVSRQQDKV